MVYSSQKKKKEERKLWSTTMNQGTSFFCLFSSIQLCAIILKSTTPKIVLGIHTFTFNWAERTIKSRWQNKVKKTMHGRKEREREISFGDLPGEECEKVEKKNGVALGQATVLFHCIDIRDPLSCHRSPSHFVIGKWRKATYNCTGTRFSRCCTLVHDRGQIIFSKMSRPFGGGRSYFFIVGLSHISTSPQQKERGCVPLDQDEQNVNNQRHCMPIYRVLTTLLFITHRSENIQGSKNDGQCDQAKNDNVRRNWKDMGTRTQIITNSLSFSICCVQPYLHKLDFQSFSHWAPRKTRHASLLRPHPIPAQFF